MSGKNNQNLHSYLRMQAKKVDRRRSHVDKYATKTPPTPRPTDTKEKDS